MDEHDWIEYFNHDCHYAMLCKCPFLGYCLWKTIYDYKTCSGDDVKYPQYEFNPQMLIISHSRSSHINSIQPNHYFTKDNPIYAPKLPNKNAILPSLPDGIIRALKHRKVLEHQLNTLKYDVCPPDTLLFSFISQQLIETTLLKA